MKRMLSMLVAMVSFAVGAYAVVVYALLLGPQHEREVVRFDHPPPQGEAA